MAKKIKTNFTKTQSDLSLHWNSSPNTREEVLSLLQASPLLYGSYQTLNEDWKQHFLDFCQGKKSLPLTYDPFFKRIFHPDIHPDRLSQFISSILGITVKVLHVLPSEDPAIHGETLLIMDLLAELEDGSLINVEIQKQGYAFPAGRISCYSADLMMRQYARVKGIQGKNFTYRDIQKVYMIVLYEKSPKIFKKIPNAYLHHGKIVFDTGLKLDLLQEYFLISLDVFRKFPYPKERKEQTGWLSLLTTENLEDAKVLIPEYPWLEEIYKEIAMLRQKPEEVLGMYSEALRILDQNTIKYMIDELQKDLEEKDIALEEKDSALKEKESALKKKDTALKEKDTALKEKNSALKMKDMQIEELKKQLQNLKKQ